MIRLDKICVWIFIFAYFFLPFQYYIHFIDELCSFLLLGVLLLDCLVNGSWRRYRPLFVVLGIFAFYTVYSVTAVHFNTTTAVLKDLVIETKPYIAFFVFMGLSPTFDQKEADIIKCIAVVSSLAMAPIALGGNGLVEATVGHISAVNQIATLGAFIYLAFSKNEDGEVPMKAVAVSLLLLSVGLLSARSKFFGIFVLTLFFLFVYKPGMFSRISPKSLCIVLSVLVLVVLVAWKKINFYFVMGSMDVLDPNNPESVARPALYAVAFLIFLQYFPFGTGLASFGTYPSGGIGESYSGVYYEYGLDKVWGLSPSYSAFVADAFYPSLAQYGVVGLVLFIIFWVYVFRKLHRLVKCNPKYYQLDFIIGVLLICFFLIEMIAAGTFSNAFGQIGLMALGAICGLNSRINSKGEPDSEASGATPKKYVL